MTATDALTTPAAAARLAGVDVRIGSTAILTGIDLDVPRGHIVAIVGGNGAGKTTLLDALAGEVPATGRIEVAGTGRVARLLQGSPLPDTLTVAEVLQLVTGHRHAARELAERFGLTASLDRRILELSTGMRRILDLAVATVDDHNLLLLDEPASGLAAAEVDHLAELLLAHRDRTGAAIVVVEHNRGLVDRIADRVVTLDRGRIVDPTTTDHGIPHEALPPLVIGDADRTAAALTAITNAGVPAPQPARHELSTWTKLRLGLREFAAGMASVLILGVLNRVMKVELGISLAIVAVVLASYNLAAPVALAIGHRSDQRPIRGRHRTPYILGGAALTALTLALAPHVADRLAAGVTVGSVALALTLFTVMGVGMYGAGTVYFALLADLTPRHERAHAASVVYLMLMGGIITGAALAATLLDDAGNGRHSLFAIAGIVVIALNVAAVWGLDPREVDGEPPEPTGAWQAVCEIAAIRSARRFFVFTLLATLFLFLQQAVLEPFGGDVLGLSVRATTGFNAVQTLGVIVGMLVTGRGIADRHGHKRTALIGLIGSSIAFAGLALAALAGSAPASWFAILAIGLTTGLFNVAVLALMMAMSVPERVALFMGAWTVSHALADGLATAGGGVIQQLALTIATTDAGAYATVFAIEAVGLALCIPLLRSIDVTTFAREVAEETARRSALAMGWITPRRPG